MRKQRERAQARAAASRANLDSLLDANRAKYDAKVSKQRRQGNKNYPEVELHVGNFDGMPAVIRYNMNGERGRIDVFYGGAGSTQHPRTRLPRSHSAQAGRKCRVVG